MASFATLRNVISPNSPFREACVGRRRRVAARPALAERLEQRRLLSATLTTLVTFEGANGSDPTGLTADSAGNLYGTTNNGGDFALSGGLGSGTAFKIAAGTSTLTTLATFEGDNSSAPKVPYHPNGGLVIDGAGNVFGTTSAAGSNTSGSVWEIANGSNTVTTRASFVSNLSTLNPPYTGTTPVFGPIADGAGNLYGTALYDGNSPSFGQGAGTIWELAAGSGTITPVTTFNAAATGISPIGVFRSSAGEFFGTTQNGGDLSLGSSSVPGDGTVFQVGLGGQIVTLHNFIGTDGAIPNTPLVPDSNFNLYGTTQSGGANNDGTVFELDNNNNFQSLASFNGANGADPTGLVADSIGDVFGATNTGGANNDGTIFEIAVGSNTITTLVSFNGGNGANPDGALVLDAAGNLYGTTNNGGDLTQSGPNGVPGDGIVYKYPTGIMPPPPPPSGTISINDPIALYNPPSSALPYQQNLTASIMNTASQDATFDFSVKQLGSGNVTLSASSLTIPAGQTMPITITPTAVSSAGNDVEIDVSSGGTLLASKKMTVVSVTIPQDIYSPDTPEEMLHPGLLQGVGPLDALLGKAFFRITPGAANSTTENVTITPDLKPIGQSVTLMVAGQSSANGTVAIMVNGNAVQDISSTGDIQLTGTGQTMPGAGGNLQLTVSVAGQNTIQSDGFSVAAIPNKVTITKADLTGDFRGLTLDHGIPTNAYGFDGEELFGSDSGDRFDILPILVKQQAKVRTSGGVFGPGVLNIAKNRYTPIANLLPDFTAISPRQLFPGSEGLETDLLLYTFNDPRTGARNIPIPGSGFFINRQLLSGIYTDEEGTNASVNGFNSTPGAAKIHVYQPRFSSPGSQAVEFAPAPGLGESSQPITAAIDSATTFSTTEIGTSALLPLAAGPAAQLAITSQPPASIAAGTVFGLTVQAQESNGALVSGFNGSITLRLNQYSGAAAAALGGTLTVTAVNGVATFSGLSLTTAGIFSITATASGLSAQTSSLCTIAPLAASTLVFGGPTGNVLTSSAFTVQAAALDPFGNIDTSFNGTVTLSFTTNPGNATLGGTISANAVNGLVAFSGLSINKTGSGYVLSASGGGLTAASSPFDVNDDQLAVSAQPPATSAAGQAFGVTVEVENAAGAIDTSYNGTITVALDSRLSGPGVALQGPVTLQVVNGVATFTGLEVIDPGEYALVASGADAANAESQLFEVAPAASQLAITVQPPAAVSVGAGFEVDVAAEDAGGNVDTSFTSNITLALAANPGGSNLGGNVTVMAVNGVATLTGLTLNNPSNGYTLTASASALASATTGAINVLPAGKATQLVFTTQPFPTPEAGGSTGVVVKAEDSFGAVDSSFTGAVTLTDPGGNLVGTLTVNAVAGVATFLTVMPEGAGTNQTLTASSPGLVDGQSNAITVTASAATQAILSGPSQDVLPGAPFTFDVFAVDPFGNVDPTYTGAITLSPKNNPSGATLGGALTVNAVAGDATFTGLTLNNTGSGFTLKASGLGLATGTSSAFDVTTDQLVLTMSPAPAVGQLSSPTITVSAEESSGNVDTSFSGPVTVALIDENAAGATGATLGGTLTVNAAGGIATFSDLTIDQPGLYALDFTASGVGMTQTDLFTVTPRIPTTIALNASATTVEFGQTSDFTATVSDSSGGQTGAGPVTFYSNGNAIGTKTLGPVGAVVFYGSARTPGLRVITASFDGNSNFLPSTISAPINVMVGPKSTVTPDLSKAVFPQVAVAGQPIRASVPVVFTNSGAALKGTFIITLYLNIGADLNTNTPQIGQIKRQMSLGAGKSAVVRFNLHSISSTVPAGDYNFLAYITDPAGDGNFASTAGTVTVQTPIVTLTATGGPVRPAAIKLNHAGVATVTIEETGNVDAIGTLQIVVNPSSDGTTPMSDVTLANFHQRVHLRRNHKTRFLIHFKVPPALSPNTYYLYFNISLGNVIATAVGGRFSVA